MPFPPSSWNPFHYIAHEKKKKKPKVWSKNRTKSIYFICVIKTTYFILFIVLHEKKNNQNDCSHEYLLNPKFFQSKCHYGLFLLSYCQCLHIKHHCIAVERWTRKSSFHDISKDTNIDMFSVTLVWHTKIAKYFSFHLGTEAMAYFSLNSTSNIMIRLY